ncbi:MAG: hypothetical protein LBD80_07740 [Tannerella sp.]|jgi:hypothetical protein|nr:hypothetical protein [Tannerella sp.]
MENRYLIICDDCQWRYMNEIIPDKNCFYVTSEEELEAFIRDNSAICDRIVIFAELQWDDKPYSDFYGLDIAISMRLDKKMLAPMCILSFLPQTYFEKNNDETVKFNIVSVRGTAFCEFPVTLVGIENAFAPIVPLLPATLAFLRLYLIDIKNLIVSINHNLRISSVKEEVEQILAKINQLSEQAIFPTLKNIVEKITTAHGRGNIEEFEDAIDKLVEKLNTLQSNELTSQDENKKKILLLEDKDDELRWARTELERYFEVHAFQDVNDVIKEIDADGKNDYRALICDWELLKPNSKRHQDRLGFEILDYASKKRFYALFSLTITDNLSVNDVNALLLCDHQVFKKAFEEEKSKALWNSYLPIIRQKVQQITELICSIPNCANWVTTTRRNQTLPSYKTQYTEKRNSADWAAFEHNISMQVNNYFDYRADESILEIREDIESLLITRRIFYRVFIPKFQNYRGSDGKRSKITSIEAAMKEFGRSTKGDNNRNKFLSDLCLKLNNLPSVGILPEEKAWLAIHNIYL